MAERNKRAAVPDSNHGLYRLKIFGPMRGICLFVPAQIMVPKNQMLMPLQFFKIPFNGPTVAEKEITNDIYGIIPVNTVVPVSHQRGIHFLCVRKGSAAVTDDVFMAQVQIGSIVDHSFTPLLPPGESVILPLLSM